MNLEHANAALFAAVSAAQGEVENATKNSVNPQFSKSGKASFADLAEILNTVRPVFSKHGLAVVQSTEVGGDMVSVTTAILHKEGGYITSTASCIPAKWDAQGIGSATTYLRRYSLAAMAGISQEDLDGNDSQHNRIRTPKAETAPSREFGLLIDAIEACEDLKVLQELFNQADGLPEDERKEVKAMARTRKAKLQKEQN